MFVCAKIDINPLWAQKPITHKSVSSSKNKKKKKLKHVFAFYINIGNLDEKDVEDYIIKTADKISLSDKYKGVECLFIPTRCDYGMNTIIKIL